MFEYKDIHFYNDYCENLEDFTLIENFMEEKGGCYVGKIMPNNSPHPIEILVRIPKTFPHNKLEFSTRSISGYPHLIPDPNQSKLGSWFCLNTAFAETAAGQLDEEFARLREWIRKQLRPELPKHIEKYSDRRGLQIFNLYQGNNPDKIKEYEALNSISDFIFIGDFAKNPKNFESCGYLNVVKHPNARFTVFQEKDGTNDQLPYIVVNHFPKDSRSFASWTEEFNWDKDTCEMLLPDFQWGKDVAQCDLRHKRSMDFLLNYSIEDIYEDQKFLKELLTKIEISNLHKEALEKEINRLPEKYREDIKWLEKSVDEIEEEVDPAELSAIFNGRLHYFAIAVKSDDIFDWFLVKVNRNGINYDEITYDLDKYTFTVKQVSDITLFSISKGNIIERERYFGRGELHCSLSTKRIAIIGLGAIGSPLAEALTRGGIRELTLWDGDIVEAGNLCRSTYCNSDIGNAKTMALAKHLKKISPFIKINTNGRWGVRAHNYYLGIMDLFNGDFYGDINYKSQEEFISSLKEYDLLIDCTASNELLHFLSYAAKEIKVLSLCITNQSRDLLCLSNHNGNLFELRKHYLSGIEQETGNFYSEGTGCYAPTFLATYTDIQALVSLCVRTINREFQDKGFMNSMIWHYNDNGISLQKIETYQLENSPITMTIPNDFIESIRKLPMLKDGENGYLLGGYSFDRTAIYVTNAISKIDAQDKLNKVSKISKGIIDFLGNICLSSSDKDEISESSKANVINLANGSNVETYNPLVACVSKQTITFYLYIGNEFVPFKLKDQK